MLDSFSFLLRVELPNLIALIVEHVIELLSSRSFVLLVLMDQDRSHDELVKADEVVGALFLLFLTSSLEAVAYFFTLVFQSLRIIRLLFVVVKQWLVHRFCRACCVRHGIVTNAVGSLKILSLDLSLGLCLAVATKHALAEKTDGAAEEDGGKHDQAEACSDDH